ncbi:hypothetical protein VNO78_10124 [Psophocarpus tetragonolobus]|uniref:Uncharacterized protein n=1 Tax=Psophocarpus tetragonolobus TaxID=3891 RepID=A0AAN9XMG1_PSOTE
MGGDIAGWSARPKKANYDERDLSQRSSQSHSTLLYLLHKNFIYNNQQNNGNRSLKCLLPHTETLISARAHMEKFPSVNGKKPTDIEYEDHHTLSCVLLHSEEVISITVKGVFCQWGVDLEELKKVRNKCYKREILLMRWVYMIVQDVFGSQDTCSKTFYAAILDVEGLSTKGDKELFQEVVLGIKFEFLYKIDDNGFASLWV